MEKATVYFTNELTPEAVVKMYRQLGVDLPGKVAVKVHSGEDGNQNYLRPEFMKPVIDAVSGTVVECNTAYGGARNETPKHIELMKKHHWSDLFDVDIMDAEGPDVQWPVENGKVLKVNYLGKNIENYDSMLVLIHFKGHPMGGYGGALKQLSIGCASSAGKTYIHTGGKVTDQNILWENTAEQDTFLEAMADAASTVAKHFAGKIAYVAVMKNLSVDCDCCAVAEDPCMNDVGILSSLDPVALDRACIDLVRNSNDPGREHFMERVNSRHGTHTIDVAEALGAGMYFEYGAQETEYLARKDKRLGAAIEQIGHIDRAVDGDLFSSVVHQIVGQQISTKAQETIWQRMQQTLGTVDAGHILAAGVPELQKLGITYRKAEYITDFARKVQTGECRIEEIWQMPDEEVIRVLSSLKGIGVWTAEMILLFCMQRPDVLSYDDLAIQRGLRMLYHHRKIDRRLFEKYRRRYSPYGSVASLYLWAIAGGAIPGMRDYAPAKPGGKKPKTV